MDKHVSYTIIQGEVIQDTVLCYHSDTITGIKVEHYSKVIRNPSFNQLNDALDNCY